MQITFIIALFWTFLYQILDIIGAYIAIFSGKSSG